MEPPASQPLTQSAISTCSTSFIRRKATATRSDASATIWSACLIALAWPSRTGGGVDSLGDLDGGAKVGYGLAGNEGPAPFSVLITPALFQLRVGVGER